MEILSIQKYIHMSPKKIRFVTYMIKDLTPIQAVERLPFVGKVAAEPLRKVIMSAIANAKQKGISEGDLVFKEVQVNEGPRLKRFRAGARGRAKPYVKPMSHIRVVLVTSEKKTSVKAEAKSDVVQVAEAKEVKKDSKVVKKTVKKGDK